ncbi:MAG: hypothetical protein ACLRFE_03700 [Clostridia bacterium]
MTDRQCWDALRDMVRAKNDEYSAFLYSLFDNGQMRDVLGYTRDTFLSKMGFNSLSEFNTYVKKKYKTVASQWIDNLSCEDLMLFLDFRCRYLQEIYDYYNTSGGRISKDNIKNIVQKTKVSRLRGYNYSRLKCSGKPPRRKGEKKIEDMHFQSNEIQAQAIEQTLIDIAFDYKQVNNASDELIEEIIAKVRTSNINIRGNLTGHKFKGKINMNKITDSHEESIEKEDMVGFTIQGSPVYEYEDGYYDSTMRKLDENEMIFKNLNNEDFIL